MKKILFVLLCILVTIVLILTSCSKSTTSTPPTSSSPATSSTTVAANAPATIKIGAMLSVTGGDSSTGVMAQFVIQYAIDEINKNGGVFVKAYNKKIPLELDLKDNQTDPEKLMAAAEQLNADGCPVVIGTTLAGISASIFEKNKLPLLVMQCDVVALTQQGYKYYFDTSQLNSGTAQAIFQLVDSLPKDQVPTKWAFFEEQADWIMELVQYFKQEAAKRDISFAYEGQYQMLAPDFSQLILGAKNAGADVLVASPTTPDGINILRQMQQLNYRPKAIIFFRAAGDPSWSKLGALGDYIIESAQWSSLLAPDNPKIKDLITAWKAKAGADAGTGAIGSSYALVQIVAAAIEKAGSLDRDAIRNAIAATDMDTVEGHTTFDANGVRANPTLIVMQWQGGTEYLVWPKGPAYNTKDVIWPIPWGK
jgi:branched-chain amino acid transport system substrate-binding protein